jgi:hypothetical protein
MPVAVLLVSWILGVAPPSLKTLGNVSLIVVGVIIASIGEIKFNLTGFLYQAGGISFEATRLVMVQRLLSSAEYKMDPLVSLYYFAPVCGVMNCLVALFLEIPSMSMQNIYSVGIFMLIANAMIAFLLNVSVVFLVGALANDMRAGLTCPDWQDFISCAHPLRHSQGHLAGCLLDDDLGHQSQRHAILRLQHCSWGTPLLQARCRADQTVHQPGRPSVERVWSAATCGQEAGHFRPGRHDNCHPTGRPRSDIRTITDKEPQRLHQRWVGLMRWWPRMNDLHHCIVWT